MRLGFETIGNACIIAYDGHAVLATDPWIQGAAYFGSWRLLHEVPDEQKNAVLKSDYLWFSHGHPDHLNPECIPLFKGKKILLPDHRGGRIATDLRKENFDVTILPNGKWVPLSQNIKVLCYADMGQDAVLLIDINGRLLINTNDCGDNGWGFSVNRIAKKYEKSFLLCLSGYGDADMMNFFTEEGKPILPPAAKKTPVGPRVLEAVLNIGAQGFIPSSSMHRYQRTDSYWANQYVVGLEEHSIGFDHTKATFYPAYIRYNCENDEYTTINPKELSDTNFTPEIFGDNWSDQLEKEDAQKIQTYFSRIEHLKDKIGFVRFKVGGKENVVNINPAHFKRGVTFEVPRSSLMTAIEYEIFEDLLIGNFMKTTLHGNWPSVSLHPDFQGFVCKFADNGRAFSKEEVAAYIAHYESLYPRLKMKRWEYELKTSVRGVLEQNALFFGMAKNIYQWFRRFAIARL